VKELVPWCEKKGDASIAEVSSLFSDLVLGCSIASGGDMMACQEGREILSS